MLWAMHLTPLQNKKKSIKRTSAIYTRYLRKLKLSQSKPELSLGNEPIPATVIKGKALANLERCSVKLIDVITINLWLGL
jgi:hypothetical protein